MRPVEPAHGITGRAAMLAALDPAQLGEALLALRKRSPKAPLSKLYDRHVVKLMESAREEK